MNTRSFVALAVTLGALAAPQAASADDLYVTAGAGATVCTKDDPCSLDQAILIADIVSNADTIHVVGPLAYSGAVDLSNSPIELIGSGRGAGGTAIDAGADALSIGRDSRVRALSVRSTGVDAVVLEAEGAIADVDVVGEDGGIRVDAVAGADVATIRDSRIVARIGIFENSGPGENAFHADRVTIEASRYGIGVQDANATLSNSVIRARAFNAEGVVAFNSADIRVEGSTIDGGGSGAIGVRSGPGSGATIVVTGSIVRGFATDLSANAIRPGYGLSVSDSDYATREGVAIGDFGGNVNADPQWVDAAAGDYRLEAGSPVIDRGPMRVAAAGETDLAGNARIVDGDGDGAGVRDIGAYEFQPGPPATDPGPSNMQGGPGAPSGQQPAPATTTPPTQPPATPPRATALTARLGKLTVNRRGRGSVRVTCSVRPCAVRLVLATTGKRPRTLARATGSAGTVRFQLSRSARALIKKRRIRTAAVTATATDAAGRRAQARRTVRLPAALRAVSRRRG